MLHCSGAGLGFAKSAKGDEPRGAFRRVEKRTGQPAHSKSLVNNKSKELVALSDFSGVLGARSAVSRVHATSARNREISTDPIQPTLTMKIEGSQSLVINKEDPQTTLSVSIALVLGVSGIRKRTEGACATDRDECCRRDDKNC